jgi:hypothetical protein
VGFFKRAGQWFSGVVSDGSGGGGSRRRRVGFAEAPAGQERAGLYLLGSYEHQKNRTKAQNKLFEEIRGNIGIWTGRPKVSSLKT